MLSGEVTFVTDTGPDFWIAGDAAGFKAGDPNRSLLANRSDHEALVLEIGTRIPGDAAHYSDVACTPRREEALHLYAA